jgi:hypothetical protein
MKIKKKRFMKGIYLVQFSSQKDMAETFLRFQEHYESPKFMGQIFTHEQFEKWYTEVKGKFSYYEDWDGFNIPSSALKPFQEGKFNPLTKNEKKLLSLFKNIKGNFYIIAFHGGGHHLLGHELAHALFYTNKEYKKKVLKILKKYNLKKIRKELLSVGGYGKNVIEDEIQAYSVSLNYELKTDIPKELRREINNIFEDYCPRII